MWANQLLLAVIGISAGVVVSAGLFALIIELGVIADFADRTHTADEIMLYEDSAALGGIAGTIVYLFKLPLPSGPVTLPVLGVLSGIFVGCWAMAVAEILNVFPIFIRRLKILRYVFVFIISMALGRGLGAYIYFLKRW